MISFVTYLKNSKFKTIFVDNDTIKSRFNNSIYITGLTE